MNYRKRIRIFTWLYISISKTGLSLTIGKKGLSITVCKKGIFLNTSLRGTGLYDRRKIGGNFNKHNREV